MTPHTTGLARGQIAKANMPPSPVSAARAGGSLGSLTPTVTHWGTTKGRDTSAVNAKRATADGPFRRAPPVTGWGLDTHRAPGLCQHPRPMPPNATLRCSVPASGQLPQPPQWVCPAERELNLRSPNTIRDVTAHVLFAVQRKGFCTHCRRRGPAAN